MDRLGAGRKRAAQILREPRHGGAFPREGIRHRGGGLAGGCEQQDARGPTVRARGRAERAGAPAARRASSCPCRVRPSGSRAVASGRSRGRGEARRRPGRVDRSSTRSIDPPASNPASSKVGARDPAQHRARELELGALEPSQVEAAPGIEDERSDLGLGSGWGIGSGLRVSRIRLDERTRRDRREPVLDRGMRDEGRQLARLGSVVAREPLGGEAAKVGTDVPQ